jgi:hypothetical protein
LAWIVIEGQAARALYEAMGQHTPKYSDASAIQYRGTKSDAMTCWEVDGAHYCNIGYDAVSNVLAVTKACGIE